MRITLVIAFVVGMCSRSNHLIGQPSSARRQHQFNMTNSKQEVHALITLKMTPRIKYAHEETIKTHQQQPVHRPLPSHPSRKYTSSERGQTAILRAHQSKSRRRRHREQKYQLKRRVCTSKPRQCRVGRYRTSKSQWMLRRTNETAPPQHCARVEPGGATPPPKG